MRKKQPIVKGVGSEHRVAEGGGNEGGFDGCQHEQSSCCCCSENISEQPAYVEEQTNPRTLEGFEAEENVVSQQAQQEAMAYARDRGSKQNLLPAAGRQMKTASQQRQEDQIAFQELKQLSDERSQSSEKDLDEQPTLPIKEGHQLVNSREQSPRAMGIINDFSRECRDTPLMSFGGRRSSAEHPGKGLHKLDLISGRITNNQRRREATNHSYRATVSQSPPRNQVLRWQQNQQLTVQKQMFSKRPQHQALQAQQSKKLLMSAKTPPKLQDELESSQADKLFGSTFLDQSDGKKPHKIENAQHAHLERSQRGVSSSPRVMSLKQQATPAQAKTSGSSLINRRERCSSGQISQKTLKKSSAPITNSKPAFQQQSANQQHIVNQSNGFLSSQISTLLAEQNGNGKKLSQQLLGQLSFDGVGSPSQTPSRLHPWNQPGQHSQYWHKDPQPPFPSQLLMKYSPPRQISRREDKDTSLYLTSDKDHQCEGQDDTQLQNFSQSIIVEARSEAGSGVLKFNNQEQMMAYNDIEQLNQFTKRHMEKISRPVKSRQVTDYSAKVGGTYLLVEHDTGSVIIERMDDSKNAARFSHGHAESASKANKTNVGLMNDMAAHRNACNRSMQNTRLQINSGQLSKLLQSKKTGSLRKNTPSSTHAQRRQVLGSRNKLKPNPYDHTSPDSHQMYRNEGLQSCESFNDSPEVSVRDDQVFEATTRVKGGGISRGAHLKDAVNKQSVIHKKAVSVQSAQNFNRGDEESKLVQKRLEPAHSMKQLLNADYNNNYDRSINHTPSLKVCIGGVPTLKQPSTQKAAQKTDIIDSFLNCDRSSKASTVQNQPDQAEGSNLTQFAMVHQDAPNPFDLITVRDQIRQEPLVRRQIQKVPAKPGTTTRNSNNLQARKPTFSQTLMRSAHKKAKTNKARSPPVTKMQGLGLDILNSSASKHGFNNRHCHVDSSNLGSDNEDDLPRMNSTVKQQQQVQQKSNGLYDDRQGDFGRDDQECQQRLTSDNWRNKMPNSAVNNGLSKRIGAIMLQSGSGTINIFDEQVRKANQHIVQKYEMKNRKRKPFTMRESNFMRAKQSREIHDSQIIVRAAQPKPQTDRPEAATTNENKKASKNDVSHETDRKSEEDQLNAAPSSENFSGADPANKEQLADQSAGMFNKLFTRIGGMFTSTNATQPSTDKMTTNFDSLDEESGHNSPSKRTNLSPKIEEAIEGLASTEEVVDPALMIRPMRRYGRICDCPKDPNFTMFCVKARNWYEMTSTGSQSLHINTDAKYSKLKETYKSLAMMTPDEDSLAQIERDLGRTFPRHHYFMKSIGGRGHEKLRRVLIAFSNYESQVKYVQGMNFIVAQILLHCSETFAFWLFVALIEDCEMRDIYEPELSGLFKHSLMIELLIKENLPGLHERLTEYHIRANVYASEWIFGLFSSVIPCDHMGLFFDLFFRHKWIFFYQVILTLLSKHADQIVNEEDFYHFTRQIKVQQYQRSGLDYEQALMMQRGTTNSEHLIDSSVISTIGNKEINRLFERSQGGIVQEDIGQQKAVDPSVTQVSAINDAAADEENKQQSTMFSAFKRFISAQVPWSEQAAANDAFKALKVTDVDFWPKVIARCQQDWSHLAQQPGIPRLLTSFDPKSMTFTEDVDVLYSLS